MRILLVNPPIYDFTAYDFWLRPYGMLRTAGRIGPSCRLAYFNYLVSRPRDSWGRGRFPEQIATKPAAYDDIARRYRRFGRPRVEFRALLAEARFDAVLIQTTMTYWYPGVREVIEDVRQFSPGAAVILGGVYATLCPEHALSLGADTVVRGNHLDPLWQHLPGPVAGLPFRDDAMGPVAAMKLTDGCPFHCTYCSAPALYPGFATRPVEECLEEARVLVRSGVKQIALYDDALLFQPQKALIPFLEGIVRERLPIAFHTPNALNTRLLTCDIAKLMVCAGFSSFFLGCESASHDWMAKTGGKSSPEDFAAAAARLRDAGAAAVIAYLILGHPDCDGQELEASMRFAHGHGVRIQLSEFAPIPGTPDGERCRPWANLDEPLSHNKTAFAIRRLGAAEVTRFKTLARDLNARLEPLTAR